MNPAAVGSARELVESAVTLAWERDARLGMALAGLAERAEVAFVQGIGTARIRKAGGGVRIELDPAFASRELREPSDVLVVLAHEVMHRVNGDLERGLAPAHDAVGALAANIVADARINSSLLDTFFPETPGLFDRLYGEASFPGLLLLPPNRLLARLRGDTGSAAGGTPRTPSEVRGIPERTLRRMVRGALARTRAPRAGLAELTDFYVQAWLSDASQASLFAALRPHLPEGVAVQLLGAHELDGGAVDESELQGDLAEVGEALGAGPGGEMRDNLISRGKALPPELEALRRQLQRSLSPDPSRSDPDALPPTRTALPWPGRREAYLLACGVWPGLFTARQAGSDDEAQRARVYLDVSGSTHRELPRLYALLRGLRTLVADPVHVFSTRVAPVSLADLGRGACPTDGGTDFTCALEHALDRRSRRVLIVTDGDGPVASQAAARARRHGLEVHVVLTEPCDGSPLRSLAASWRRLPGAQTGLPRR